MTQCTCYISCYICIQKQIPRGSQMSVTIRDVAKESGFSIATISRAFANIPSVKPETRQRILEVAKELGYLYQPHGRRDPRRSQMIMLIVGDIMNQFYWGIIKGANDRLGELGIKLAIFCSEYDPAREEDLVRYADEKKYDGVIMVTAMETPGLVSILKTANCPVVLANRTIRSMDLNTVCIDNYRGGYMAASFLADEGHRNIAHLAGPDNSTASQDRERGFRDALKDYQLTVSDAAVRYGNLKRDSGYEYGCYFLNNLRDYTAVFCANDLMAAGFCDCLIEAGVTVPDDVSVICFDDSPAAVSGSVRLTTISRDPYPMGQTAAEMMIEEMANRESKRRKIIFPPTLNVRDSVRKNASVARTDI